MLCSGCTASPRLPQRQRIALLQASYNALTRPQLIPPLTPAWPLLQAPAPCPDQASSP